MHDKSSNEYLTEMEFPAWIRKFGSFLIIVSVALFLGVTSLVEYPKIISVKAQMHFLPRKNEMEIRAGFRRDPDEDGNIDRDQRCIIKIYGYPQESFGMISGVIDSIYLSKRAQNDTLLICLPTMVKTSYNKLIYIQKEKQCLVEVAIHRENILNRVIKSIKNGF